jgi:hypothetical protein
MFAKVSVELLVQVPEGSTDIEQVVVNVLGGLRRHSNRNSPLIDIKYVEGEEATYSECNAFWEFLHHSRDRLVLDPDTDDYVVVKPDPTPVG